MTSGVTTLSQTTKNGLTNTTDCGEVNGAAEDIMRSSERSRIISPALQQAVESAVAEVEEATFGRGKWFDIQDDLKDQQNLDVQIIRSQLDEDFKFVSARKAIAECWINSAVFGAGMAEIVADEEIEMVPATSADYGRRYAGCRCNED